VIAEAGNYPLQVKNRFVSTTEQGAIGFAKPVISLGINAIDMAHDSTKVGFCHLEQ